MREASIIWEFLPSIIDGFIRTVALSLAVIATATPLALALALARTTRLGWILAVYVNFIRLMPALIILYASFYALPQFGIRLSPYQAAYFGLTAVSCAYISEDMRGALKSIDRGQYAAAKALGLPAWRVLRRITIPQALPVFAPNYMTDVMLAVQGTSLASLVAVTELSAATSRAIAISQDAYFFLALSAALYLALNSTCAALQAWFVKRISVEGKMTRAAAIRSRMQEPASPPRTDQGIVAP